MQWKEIETELSYSVQHLIRMHNEALTRHNYAGYFVGNEIFRRERKKYYKKFVALISEQVYYNLTKRAVPHWICVVHCSHFIWNENIK